MWCATRCCACNATSLPSVGASSTRLAGAYQLRRREIEGRTGSDEANWDDECWRAARVHETYHHLCADTRAALPEALGELVSAYRHGLTTLRHWVDVVARAGEDTETTATTEAGQRLRAALNEPDPPIAALTVLLSHTILGSPSRALAYALRGRQHRKAKRYAQATADYDRAIELGLAGTSPTTGAGWSTLMRASTRRPWPTSPEPSRQTLRTRPI